MGCPHIGPSVDPKPRTPNKVFANGMAAVVVYTTRDKFEDKGNPLDGIVFISVRPKP